MSHRKGFVLYPPWYPLASLSCFFIVESFPSLSSTGLRLLSFLLIPSHFSSHFFSISSIYPVSLLFLSPLRFLAFVFFPQVPFSIYKNLTSPYLNSLSSLSVKNIVKLTIKKLFAFCKTYNSDNIWEKFNHT